MERAIIFLNGDPPDRAATDKIDFSRAFTICADGAYSSYAAKLHKPDIIIGDFDSMDSGASLEGIECERHSSRKDRTDSQLALLKAVELGYKTIDIYGAFGGRRDHEFVNYSLLSLASVNNATAVLRGGQFDVFFVTAYKPFVGELAANKIVSLVPYGESAHILSTKGLSYGATNVSVEKQNIFTTSNFSVGGKVEYRLLGGEALLFVEN